MDDFDGALNRILSDPESMEKIFSIAKSLGAEPPEQSGSSALPDLSMLSGMGKLLQQAGQDDERQTALLQALKPFLRPERQRSLERAIRVAKLSRLARYALENLNETP